MTRTVLLRVAAIACCVSLVSTAGAAKIRPGARRTVSSGVAWQVQGPWRALGRRHLISSGDAIEPGSLLHPEPAPGAHSIVILLPDGQRIFYECYLAADCSRNFRVPLLYRRPDPFAVEFLARVQAVLARRHRASPQSHPWGGQDEMIAPLSPRHQVELAGLAAQLSNGQYSCEIRSLDNRYPSRSHVPIDKTGPSLRLALPAPGLYDIRIFDRLNMPRIDLLVGAPRSARAAPYLQSFHQASALLKDWNIHDQGWPVHVFRRAYIEWLFLRIPLQATAPQTNTARDLGPPGTVAEPAFSPQPGVLEGDAAVTITSNTPGAVIHYTVDSSQPLNGSPVYRAPIMVRGTGLTIKAFATAPNQKDSAVVTGIFRLHE